MAAPPPPSVAPTPPVVAITQGIRKSQQMKEIQRVYAKLRPQIQWIYANVNGQASQANIHPSQIGAAANYIHQQTKFMNDQIDVEKNELTRLEHTTTIYSEAIEVFVEEIEAAEQDLKQELPLDEITTDELINKIIDFARPLHILPQLKLELEEDGTDQLVRDHKNTIRNLRTRYRNLEQNVGATMAKFCSDAADGLASQLKDANNEQAKELCEHVEQTYTQGFEQVQTRLERMFDVAGTFAGALENVLERLGGLDRDQESLTTALKTANDRIKNLEASNTQLEQSLEKEKEEVSRLQGRVLVQDPFLKAALNEDGKLKPLIDWAQFALGEQPAFTHESPYIVINHTSSVLPAGHALYLNPSQDSPLLVYVTAAAGSSSIRLIDPRIVRATYGSSNYWLEIGSIADRIHISNGLYPTALTFWAVILRIGRRQ